MRSLPQNDIFHTWCGVVSTHLVERGVRCSKDMVKELVLMKLGNTTELLGEKIAMRSSKYKQTDGELSVKEQQRGFVSMAGLLTSMEAWAATDLDGLKLSRDEE